MDDFEKELKADFLEESTDLLQDAEAAFLLLEEDRSNPELINKIFRLAHNLKGTSKAVGFEQLSEMTHVAENLILKIKEKEFEVTDVIVSVLLEFKDKVTEMVEILKEDVDANLQTEEIQRKIQEIINAGGVTAKDNDSTEDQEQEITEKPSDFVDSKNVDIEPTTIDEPVLEQIVKESQGSKEKLEKPKNSKPTASDGSIRVKLSRIGKINDVVGELVILQTVISQRRFDYCQDEIMNKSIGSMNKLFKEVQEIAMSLRMLPLRPTFQKMSRIVRDVSIELGKDVDLRIIGEDTEVDKTVLEKLSDPLVHIIRNAVDHGLETTAERKEKGKLEKGIIELKAYHEGSQLIVEIIDDGKGINPEIIREKAISKNILTPQQKISDDALVNLIFHPGFSTKEKVTDVSGRGVGMDVVKTNIDSLGGEVKVISEVGKGSRFTISLPLTLAIVDGMVIKAEKEKYVIPLSQISEIVQVSSDEVKKFTGVADLFEIRGEVLPIFSINKKLNLSNKLKSKSAIIIRGLSHSFAVTIDDIINQQQIVIKKLGGDLDGKEGIMGSAIMSDGRPALILDLFELFRNDVRASDSFGSFSDKSNAVV